MGQVFKAYDRRLHEAVAVKIIRPEIGSDPQAMERFDNELRLARRIAHKNVARMFDVGEDGGIPYITMEYVSGEDLRSLIQRIGLLPIAKVLAVGRQIAEGLAEAHGLGIIHRDLKPHNIMIDREGNARIMDFGIARFVKTKRMTEVGVLLGTPEYMPPEQIEGSDSDARSDIYSLGIILFEMTTGRLPFTGDTPLAVAMRQKSAAPPSLRSLNPQTPPALDAVILKCLEKKPDRRFASASVLAAELASLEKGLSTSERAVMFPVQRPTRDVTIKFNIRHVIIPIAAVTILAVAAVGVWVILTKPGAPTAIRAERPRPAAAMPEILPTAIGPADEPAGKPVENTSVKPADKTDKTDKTETKPDEKTAPEKAPAAKPQDQPVPPKASPQPPSAISASPAAFLARSRAAWAKGDAEAAATAARQALAVDSANGEARGLLEAAERRIDEKAVMGLVSLYDQALDGNRLTAFYGTHAAPELAAEVRLDAEAVAGLFARFDSSVSGTRVSWSGRDAAEVSFEQRLLGFPKEGGAEQALFQGTMHWRVEKRSGRWVIASIKAGD
jgi:outer membrane biosynthesis protein TonB